MANGSAILLHPAALRRREPGIAGKAALIALQLLLVASVIVGGTILLTAALVLAFVSAPIAAAIVLWIAWRSADGGAREARRLRARVRRRARALGLRVLAAR